MKKIACLLIIASVLGCTQAKNGGNKIEMISAGPTDSTQMAATEQSQQNIQNIPAYRILNTDSVFVTQASLEKHKPVMFIYFSPDCSHCTKFLDELKPHLKEFSKFQIVMITWIKFAAVKPYYDKMGFAAYKNITMGTEGDDLLVQQYFQVKDTPYIAIYGRMGKLAKTYVKAPKATDLVADIKKI